uniref:Protein kinase domain-containing protein n=1 Tax=Paramoeba aestuarina TaxID=180227 RepID=A0A7S4NZ23_9EUKA|mmetsp:Transcript_32837/g.51327  ORF Transcript_32837/g.51327 Transcript_32837/m.51327 type:complete len:813 (+) Transcript_32837:162-2600(+)
MEIETPPQGLPPRRKSSSPTKYRKGKEKKLKDREKEEKGKEKEKEKEKFKESQEERGKLSEKKKVKTVSRVASGENRLRFDMVPRCPHANDNPLTAREKEPKDDEGKSCLVRSKSLHFSQDPQPQPKTSSSTSSRKSPPSKSPSRKSPFGRSPDQAQSRRVNPKGSFEDIFALEDNGKRRKTILSRSTSFAASKSTSSIAKDRKSQKGDESPPPPLTPTTLEGQGPSTLANSFEAQKKRKRKIKSMLKPKESKNVDIVRNFVGPGNLSFADIAQRGVVQSREEDEDNFSLDNTCADQTEGPSLLDLEEFLEAEEPPPKEPKLPLRELSGTQLPLETQVSSPRKGSSPRKVSPRKGGSKFDSSGGGSEDTQRSENPQIRRRRYKKKGGSRFLQRASVISSLLQNRPTKDELEEKTAIFPDHQKKQDTMAMLNEFLDHSLSSYSCNTTESDFDDTQSDTSQIGHWSSERRSSLSVETFPSELTPRDPFSTPRDLPFSQGARRDSSSFSGVRRDSNSTYSSSSCSSSSSSRLASSASSNHSFSEEFFKAVDGKTIDYQNCIEIQRPVGRGKFGTVFKGKWKGKDVAVKRLQLSSFAQTEKSFLREVTALRKAEECRSIVNLVGVCCCPCAIVMELWEGGSLYDMIHVRQQKTSLNETLRVLSDVAEALRFLHDSLSPSIIHRDVTTRNILLRKRDERLEACLADFGIATTSKKKGAPMSPIGRLRYMAPEVTDKAYTKKADQYMFGNVIYEIVVRQKPFHDLTAEEAARRRKQGEIPEIPDSCPKRFAELMQDCWEFKPKDRPSMKEICRRLASI